MSPFKNRNFWSLTGYQVCESLSEFVAYAAITLIVVGPSSHSLDSSKEFVVFAMLAAGTLGRVAAARTVAHLVDRYRWKPTLLVAGGLRLGLALGIVGWAVAPLPAAVSIGVLGLLVTAQSGVGQLIDSCRAAAYQVEIPADYRKRAAGFSMFLLTAVGICSGFFAAALLAVASLPTALWCCVAASALGVATISAGYRQPDQPITTEADPQPQWQVGASLVKRVMPLRAVAVASLSYGVCLGLINFSLPFYCLVTLSMTPWQFVTIEAIFSAGMMVGAVVMPMLGRWLTSQTMLLIGTAGVATSYLILAAAHTYWVACCGMALNGVLLSLMTTSQGPLLQEFVPEGSMGSVTSVILAARQALNFTAATIALVVAVWLVPNNSGVHRGAYAIAGVVLIAAAVAHILLTRQRAPQLAADQSHS